MIHNQRRSFVPSWILLSVGVCLLAATAPSIGAAESGEESANSSGIEYRFWKEVGAHTAIKALRMMRAQEIHVRSSSDLVVLTNAGYAKVDARDTMGALDGLTRVLKVSRGNHSLVEVHSAPDASLWFAVYHQSSGACAYLQIDPQPLNGASVARDLINKQLYSIETFEYINAQRIFDNADEYATKFNNRIFGGNEFRIVTISNAIANGAPSVLVRAFELHDHFCPGVASGVFLAEYLQKAFPLAAGGKYFIHSVQVWCKEDAILAILNTTPGKKGYAASYSTPEDREGWIPDVQNAADIIYRYNPETKVWDGIVVSFDFGTNDCPVTGNSVIDKLCRDLKYIDLFDQPEQFVEELHQFTLPDGVDPKLYARPGVDPMEMLGLTQ